MKVSNRDMPGFDKPNSDEGRVAAEPGQQQVIPGSIKAFFL
jgi:hypothetical protein